MSMLKHTFGFSSQCAVCKNEVTELYGSSYDIVIAGAGLCEICKNDAEKKITNLQKINKPVVIPVVTAEDKNTDVPILDRLDTNPE